MDLDSIADLRDRNRSDRLQNFCELTFVFRRHGEGYHVRHVAVEWNVCKELLQRLDAAG